jgi:hypothetical protein
MTHYTKREFIEDLVTADKLLYRVIGVGDEIRCHLARTARKFGENPEIAVVGSTTPQRLTCVIDPTAPDNRSGCDFDIIVVWPTEIDAETKVNYLRALYPRGNLIQRPNGSVTIDTYVHKYPVSIVVASESEITDTKSYAPIFYANIQKLTEEQKRTSRALKLLCMRSGIYGGYTMGFKGIAIEHLAKQCNTLEDSISEIHKQLTNTGDLKIPSILDDYNLTERISPDIINRTVGVVKNFSEQGLVRKLPYSLDAWAQDHPTAKTLMCQSPIQDPHECYKQFRKISIEAINPNIKRNKVKTSQYVMPCMRNNEILISIDGLNEQQQEEWHAKFLELKGQN